MSDCNSDTLSQSIASYLRDAALGISKNTLDIYRWNLGQLAKYLVNASITSLAHVTADHLRAFFGGLKESGYSLSTVDQHYRGVRTFFRWCVHQEFLDFNPMTRVRRTRLPQPIHNNLDFDAICKVLEATRSTLQPERDFAVIALFLDTGIRRQELVDLQLGDVDLSGHVLTIRLGKGAKGRRVPLSDGCSKALADWLAVRPPETIGLFGFKTGDGVYLFTSRLSRKVGFRFSPHDLRHSFATLYGGDVQDLQKILGHSDVSTTASIYRYRDVASLIKVHNERSPMSQLPRTK